MNSRKRRWEASSAWRAFGVALAILFVVYGCRSLPGEPEVENPATATAPADAASGNTATPASPGTPNATPTTSSGDIVAPATSTSPPATPATPSAPSETISAGAFEMATLSVPICNTSLRNGVLPGFGTVPVPTPTPTPTPLVRPTPRSAGTAKSEVASYLSLVAPILDAAEEWIVGTNEDWESASDLVDYGVLIHVEGRRIAALCSAFAFADTPPEAEPASDLLAELLNGRQSWATETARNIRDFGRSSSPQLDADRVASVGGVETVRRSLRTLASTYSLPISNDATPIIRENERVRVSLQQPAGWFLVRSDSQFVFAGPPELQAAGIRGLGAAREGFGTSLRIRRLRNAAGWVLKDAENQIAPLLEQFGIEIGVDEIQVDGFPGASHTLEDEELGWQTVFSLTVAGQYSFFFEMSCPAEYASGCNKALESTIASASLSP